MNENNECITEGCNRPVAVKKRQMCTNHYQTWARANKPRSGVQPCSIEDCDKVIYAKGYCQQHYARAYQYGDPLYVRPVKTCKCGARGNAGRGMCKKHYQQWYYHNVETVPGEFNADHGNAKPIEELTYNSAHYRLRRARGKASQFVCLDCGGPATDWALKHDAADKRIDINPNNQRTFGSYFSTNPYDYEPRCSDCHKAYDAKYGNRKYKTGAHSKAYGGSDES